MAETSERGGAAAPQPRSFRALGVAPWLCDNLRSLGITAPTPIQTACIPPILQGRDALGAAETGSGKTAAFALPVLQRLAEDPYGIYAVVLTPTRELAFQIADQYRSFGASMGIRCAVIVGGLEIQKAAELSRKPHVVVATPGRLADHIRSTSSVDLSRAKVLVLDEADRLLEKQFRSDLHCILDEMPSAAKRQTLLFSATVTTSLEALKSGALRSPFVFDAREHELATVKQLAQKYIFMPAKVKELYLVHLLRTLNDRSVIVFVAKCYTCELLRRALGQLDIDSTALHSRMSQENRLASLARFRSGLVRVLLATDVASRGLDIPTVGLVINFDVPGNPKDYVHRVGRTARAGRKGISITLVSQFDVELVQEIEGLVGVQMEEHETPEDEVLDLFKDVSMALRYSRLQLADSGFEERDEAYRARKKQAQRAADEARKSADGAKRKEKSRDEKKEGKTSSVTKDKDSGDQAAKAGSTAKKRKRS